MRIKIVYKRSAICLTGLKGYALEKQVHSLPYEVIFLHIVDWLYIFIRFIFWNLMRIKIVYKHSATCLTGLNGCALEKWVHYLPYEMVLLVKVHVLVVCCVKVFVLVMFVILIFYDNALNSIRSVVHTKKNKTNGGSSVCTTTPSHSHGLSPIVMMSTPTLVPITAPTPTITPTPTPTPLPLRIFF